MGRKIVNKQVGIGIIGTGFARRVQMPAFMACDGARLISVASGDLNNARAAAGEFSIGHVTADWRETVSHPDVDLVCITTPPNLHREMVLSSLERGKNVLCEKPMAMNAAEAAEMAAAAAGKPVLSLIDHELRFQSGRQAALRMLRDKAIGDIRHAKAIFQAPHRGDPTLPWNWWSDAGAGGGALGAIASHVIDSFHWLLGSGISSVFADLQTHIKHRKHPSGELRIVTTDDECNMLLRFDDGELTRDATGLVSISMTEYPRYRNAIEIYGSAGAMRIEHRGEVYLTRSGDNDWTLLSVEPDPVVAGLPDTGFAAAFFNFAPILIDAIRSGATHLDNCATFDDGLRVQRVLDAARMSDEQDRRVSLSEFCD